MTISQTAILVALVLPVGLLQPGGISAGAPTDQICVTGDLIKQKDSAEAKRKYQIVNRSGTYYWEVAIKLPAGSWSFEANANF